MRVLLLGHFEARHDGRAVEIRRRQERLLLALLALEPGRPVSIERLVDLIWDGLPPASARAAIHTYTTRLRTALKPYELGISSQANGYVLTGELDVDVSDLFELSRRADQEADASARAELLRSALDLCRGPLLADLASDRLRDRISGPVAVTRTSCLIRRGDALLALGRPDLVTAEIGPEVAGSLPHETLVARQMLALYRTNRRPDALSLFDRVRREIADDCGLDPGTELQDLHLAILRDDPELRPAVAHRSGRNQLPRAVTDFVGRTTDLQMIDQLVDADRSGLVAITALGGMSGVGKTAVALQWAHHASARFPDGRYYLNLRGYDLEAPLTTIEALTQLLRALGQSNESIPADESAAGARYRELLADRRALIILDNARTAEQVRPLIPGTATSTVLVTSRDHLTGLVARDGARLHVLDVLRPEEAVELLALLIGRPRVLAELPAAEQIVAMVGHLPLAVRIIGAHLAQQPRLGIAGFAADFSDDRLAGLEVADDPRTSIRLLFQHSYEALPQPEQRLFRLLGAAPLIDVTEPAAARLTGMDSAAAGALLRRLTDLSLLSETTSDSGPVRYTFHDLVREFARDRANADEPPADRETAIARLIDWYVVSIRGASETLHPAFVRLPHPVESQRFESDLTAREFLDAELHNVMLVIPHAASTPRPEPSWLIADALRGYFWAYEHRHAWAELTMMALSAATANDDLRARAALHCSLGTLAERHQQPAESLNHLRRGLDLSETAGWDEGSASLLNNLGNALYSLGDLPGAAEHIERAFKLNSRLGRPGTSGLNLINLSLVQGRLGDLHQALASLETAVAIFRETHDRTPLSVALHNRGNMRHRLGAADDAAADYAEALDLYRALGNPDGEGLATSSLAALRRDQGRLAVAEELARAAVELLTAHQEHISTVMARNTLASILLRQDRADHAAEIYLETARAAEQLDLPRPQAEALIGIARANVQMGDLDAGTDAASRALALADGLGMPLVKADALLALAEADAAKNSSQARDSATEALAIFTAAGAATSVAEATAILAALPAD